jgi:hypothetical protein
MDDQSGLSSRFNPETIHVCADLKKGSRAMPFQPGQSGNPSGRPKSKMADGRSISDVAKEHTEAAIKALVAIVRDKRASASARVQAATALLDRGWGRPHQTVSTEIDGRPDMAEQVRRGVELARKEREMERLEGHPTVPDRLLQ